MKELHGRYSTLLPSMFSTLINLFLGQGMSRSITLIPSLPSLRSWFMRYSFEVQRCSLSRVYGETSNTQSFYLGWPLCCLKIYCFNWPLYQFCGRFGIVAVGRFPGTLEVWCFYEVQTDWRSIYLLGILPAWFYEAFPAFFYHCFQ